MTLTIQTNKPIAIDTPNGGRVAWNGTDSKVPGTFGRTPTGALLGPLEFGVPNSGTLAVEDITFGPGEDQGGLFAFGVLAGVPAIDDDQPLTRRGALAFLGAAAAAVYLTQGAVADDDEIVTLRVATLEVSAADAPFSIRVLDLVDDVLPKTTEILVDQRSTRVGAIADIDDSVHLRPEEGEIRVYVRDSIGRLSRLLAWARSNLPGDTSLEFNREFPDGKLASEFNGNEFVRLTDHPAIVNPVLESGSSRTAFYIGDEQVPHIDDGADELGAWDIVGDELIYEVGENPPAESEWSVATQLSFIQSIRA